MCITSPVSRVPGSHSHKYVAELQRVWGAKGRGGPVVLQSRVEEGGEEELEDGDDGVKAKAPRAETRLQLTAKALYFLAYHTGAVYRDNDNSDSESESDKEGDE